MVGEVAGVVGVVVSVVGAAADVDEEVIGADRIYASSVVVALKKVEDDGEREATRHGREVGDDGHLVRLGSCTHTPYLARHCRRKLVGSLSWGIPTVVVYR